ncbi:DUF6894 family protein [Pararhizobium sp. DWP1-1-3]|uniref:DUF6894 family protein n=1 Tax=Pararhizobium sp. DWP1-1-3 TaxID=2804652 RepID=UPI003CF58CEC
MAQKFFFHLRDGDSFDEDTVGVDLPNSNEARRQGRLALHELIIEEIATGLPVGDRSFEVTDEEGFMHFKLAFRDIVHR